MRLEAVVRRYGLRQPWIIRDVTAEVSAGGRIPRPGRRQDHAAVVRRQAAGLPVVGPSRPRQTNEHRLDKHILPSLGSALLWMTGSSAATRAQLHQ